MTKKAFSIIELSVVILIIGIIIAGLVQSKNLIFKFRLQSARSLTQSSPVHGIKNLVTWLETTSEKSFDSTVDISDSNKNQVTNWYDINTQSTTKNNAQQINNSNKPRYVISEINGLPILRFDSNQIQHMNLPDDSVPSNRFPYTIFFVLKIENTTGNRAILASGSYSSNQCNCFRFRNSRGVTRQCGHLN